MRKRKVGFVRFCRGRPRVAVATVLAVLGLAVLGSVLSPSWVPRELPADSEYGSLPPMPEPASSAGLARGEVRREDVRIPVREEVLDGTIVSPAEPGRYPAVVVVPGAGPGRRSDHVELAEHFARAGIAALAYDKRTVGYSAVTNRDFGLLAEDALVAVRLMRQREDVDPTLVGLWGISEGGWVVPIAASRSPEEVAFSVLVSAPMVSPREQLTWWAESGLSRRGAPEGLREAAAKALGMGGFGYVYHDPLQVLERVSRPVLAIYGVQDRAVPVLQSSRELEAALDRDGNRWSYTIRFFAGADHGLRADNGRFAPGYLRTMVDWVKGLSATAEPPPGTQIAGAAPVQRYAADAPPVPPPYATGTALAVGFGLAGAGFLAGPVAALVARRGGKPAGDDETWRGIRRLLRWLAVSGISTHLLFNLVVVTGIVLALTQVGSFIVVIGGWLVVRLAALATVVLAVTSAEAAVSAACGAWKPTGAQAVSLAGSFGATGVLLLIAAYWGLFAFRW